MEAGILHLSYPPRGGTCVYFVKASSGGSPPRRTRRLRACALSPLGIRDTDRDAPPCRPRLGRSSRRRAGLPPSAAPPHETMRARAMRRDGRPVRARPVKKGKERSHGKAHDHRHEERHSPQARVPTDLRPDGENVRTRGLLRRERGEEPHALEQQGLRAHERGLRALRHVLEGLPERRREEDAVQAPEEVLRDMRFFRDPCNSRQTPHVERNREETRRALVKGASFDALTQILPNSGAAVRVGERLKAGRSHCRRDERPKRGPHHDALRAVSRIPSAKNPCVRAFGRESRPDEADHAGLPNSTLHLQPATG